MKLFAAIIAIALTIVTVNGSAYAPGGPAGLKGGPACQKSVLISCAPLVQSVPCKSGGGGAGHVGGAYSEPLPQYAVPAEEMAVPEEVPAASEFVPKYAVPKYTPYYRYY